MPRENKRHLAAVPSSGARRTLARVTRRGSVLVLVAVVSAAVGGAAFVRASDVLRDGPGSAGTDVWANRLPSAPPVVEGAVRRLASGLNEATDTSFELEWPASDEPTYFFVSCDQGKIEIAMSGGGTGIQCHGDRTAVTAVGSHAKSEWITVTVDRPQRRAWGAALYR